MMNIKNIFIIIFSLIFVLIILSQIDCSSSNENKTTREEMIKRGEYLVDFGSCNECHTPKIFTDMGPIPDTTKLLAGHVQGSTLPRIDTSIIDAGKWYMVNNEFSAWVGPWGISFANNLTPNEKTGIGNWTEEMFINAMKNGSHIGSGRPFLPPMPYTGLASLKDEDLKSIFAYLKSIKPVNNKVPDPIPIDEVRKKFGK